MSPRDQYVAVVQALALTPRFEDIPDAVSASAWIAKEDEIILSVSPSTGAFMDWLVYENDNASAFFGEPVWSALFPNIAWYAAYMDVLLNHRPQHQQH
jgi:hypothetical protein